MQTFFKLRSMIGDTVELQSYKFNFDDLDLHKKIVFDFVSVLICHCNIDFDELFAAVYILPFVCIISGVIGTSVTQCGEKYSRTSVIRTPLGSMNFQCSYN